MVRRLTCLAAAFFLVAASAHAQQPSRLDDIVKRGAFRVGITGDYLPFTYLDKATSKFSRLQCQHGRGARQGPRHLGRGSTKFRPGNMGLSRAQIGIDCPNEDHRLTVSFHVGRMHWRSAQIIK
jgi:ABC-type amino acid transport substrate-binding protein